MRGKELVLTNERPTEEIVTEVLATIDREREREIISRRFGLFDRKETLEQIGEMLGITRERVRQLEKSVLSRLVAASEQGKLSFVTDFEAKIIDLLNNMGQTARVSRLAAEISETPSREELARVAFLCQLSTQLTVLNEDDNFYNSVSIKASNDEKALKNRVSKLVDTVKQVGEPETIGQIAKAAGIEDPKEAEALAGTSKQLATLNSRWGLVKWPMVNPKNIRDKIYVILKENGKHMHFNEIADSIKDSEFKRKDVTTQAIHNELIKDKRFVLVGRGIYALKEWGYEKGTVADIISEVLREADEPLHRDEILNLQGKPQFKRVAKATYALSE
jgi:hypothetical protein